MMYSETQPKTHSLIRAMQPLVCLTTLVERNKKESYEYCSLRYTIIGVAEW